MRSGYRDLEGQVFGRLTALEPVPMPGKLHWRCRCSCGKEATIAASSLTSGRTRSCGCLADEDKRLRGLIHGHAVGGETTPEYDAWRMMVARCRDPRNCNYHHYGARGITVCDAWADSFQTFLLAVGPKPGPEYSIGRIDNDGNYEPGNVRWENPVQQANNRRTNRKVTAFGRTQNLKEWAIELGMPRQTIADRLARGCTPEQALTPAAKKEP